MSSGNTKENIKDIKDRVKALAKFFTGGPTAYKLERLRQRYQELDSEEDVKHVNPARERDQRHGPVRS